MTLKLSTNNLHLELAPFVKTTNPKASPSRIKQVLVGFGCSIAALIGLKVLSNSYFSNPHSSKSGHSLQLNFNINPEVFADCQQHYVNRLPAFLDIHIGDWAERPICKTILNTEKTSKVFSLLLSKSCDYFKFVFESGHEIANISISQILPNLQLDSSHGGATLLSSAIENNKSCIIETLLQAKANVNLADAQGVSPLFVAIETSNIDSHGANLETIRQLIAAGANVNHVDCLGRTPLSVAINRYQFEAAKLLLQAGANCLHSDFNGQTPLSLAKQSSDSNIFDSIEKNLNREEACPLVKPKETC